MKTIRDRIWRDHIRTGRMIDEFEINGYRMLFLEVTEQFSFMLYYYRLIVFPKYQKEPTLALNLESNPVAGTCCLGAHIGNVHENLGFADVNMSEEDFRIWAIDTVKRYLGIKGEQPEPQVRIGLVEIESSPSSHLIDLIEDAFELAHVFVNFRRNMYKKAGGIFGMFKRIDYYEIDQSARELKLKFNELHERITSGICDSDPVDLVSGLLEYSQALCEAAHLQTKKTDMMLQLSKNPKSISWEQFNIVCAEEEGALGQSQLTGDKLTEIYHVL